MGGLGCDNMTVVLVCLLQNMGWDHFVARCNRPRAATPTPRDEHCLDEDSSSPANFVTPPRTPTKQPADGAEPDHAASTGDQRVPDVVQPPSSATTAAAATDAAVAAASVLNHDDDDDDEQPPADFTAESSDHPPAVVE